MGNPAAADLFKRRLQIRVGIHLDIVSELCAGGQNSGEHLVGVGKNVILAETSDHGNRIHNAGTCRPGKKIALITKLSGGFHDAFPCFRAQTLRLGVIPQCQGNRRLVDLRRFCNVFDRNRHVLTLIQHSVKRFRSSILIINRFLILSRGEKTGKSFFSGKIGKTSAEMEFLPFFFESRLVFLPLSWYFP